MGVVAAKRGYHQEYFLFFLTLSFFFDTLLQEKIKMCSMCKYFQLYLQMKLFTCLIFLASFTKDDV